MMIEFRGCDLDVFFNVDPPDDSVGHNGSLDIYRVEYGGCDVTDILYACDCMNKLTDMLYEERDSI